MNRFVNILFLLIGTSLVLIASLNPRVSREAASWMGLTGFLCILGSFILEYLAGKIKQ